MKSCSACKELNGNKLIPVFDVGDLGIIHRPDAVIINVFLRVEACLIELYLHTHKLTVHKRARQINADVEMLQFMS